jgi:DNA-binding IclR family transcriptional regulator
VGSLDHGLAILRIFAREDQVSPMRVASILGISTSTAYRLISALIAEDFLERDLDSRQVKLGPAAAEVGMAAVSRLNITQVAYGTLRGLAAACKEAVFLAVPRDDAMVYLHREEGPHPVTLNARLGSRKPLHCTGLGKAYLSALPPLQRAEVVGRLDLARFTANTITNPDELLEELDRVAQRGYARDNVEGEPGVACYAAPVRDHRGEPVGSISVAGPQERIIGREAELAPRVMAAAAEVSRHLGYAPRS